MAAADAMESGSARNIQVTIAVDAEVIAVASETSARSRSLTLTRTKTDRHVAWLANFHVVVALAFLVKGIAVLILDYAPVVFKESGGLAEIGSGVLFITWACGCFLGSGPVIKSLGLKRALVFGLGLMTMNYVLFGICAFIGDSNAQWPLFIIGMFVMGVGAALFLIIVCLYMTQTAAILAEESPGETESQLADNLGGSLAAWSLGTEVIMKLFMAAARDLKLDMVPILVVLTLFSIVCIAALLLTRDLPVVNEVEAPPGGAIRAFFSLWLDPCIWLLAFLPAAFALIDAVVTNHVNPKDVVPQLGDGSIGILTSLASLSGALFAKPYGFLGAQKGSALPMCIAAFSFALVPLLVTFTDVATSDGWWVSIIYVLIGSGRAVVEGILRALYGQFFAGPLLETAYANMNFQQAIMSGSTDILLTFVSTNALFLTGSVVSLLTLPGYMLAVRLLARRARAKGGPGDKASGEKPSIAAA